MLGAGTSPEHPSLNLDPERLGVQINFALNNTCNLTEQCGTRCLLNVVQPRTEEMPTLLRSAALGEVLDAGRHVRFLTFCEKEPFVSWEFLQKALIAYRQRSADRRPQSVGCISNGLLIDRHCDWLRDAPLDWCLVSLDGMPQSHLRGRTLWNPAFQNLLALRQRGGARVVGVNTVVTAENLKSVFELGHVLISEGVDYWGLGVYMRPDVSGHISCSLSLTATKDIIFRIAEEFGDNRIPVVFEVEPEAFELIAGADPFAMCDGPWRLEYTVARSFRIATINPAPGKWIRLRFDGQLLDKSDLLTIGTLEGRYGRYEPGKIGAIIEAATQTEDVTAGAIA